MTRPSRVLFFGTCLVNSFAPQAGLAAMRLLQRAGLQVIYPPGQSCCGQPADNSGYRADARPVGRTQIQALSGSAPIVVPSASCAAMLRIEYPRLFAGTPEQEAAENLAARVYEFCEFLARVLKVTLEDRGPPIRVALHQSCSARRALATADCAAALLGQLDRVEVLEPERATDCCGFGGSFAVKQPELSAAMTADKAEAIRATAATVLVSQDLGCLLNLDGRLRRIGAGIETQHIAEFLWQRVAPGAPDPSGGQVRE